MEEQKSSIICVIQNLHICLSAASHSNCSKKALALHEIKKKSIQKHYCIIKPHESVISHKTSSTRKAAAVVSWVWENNETT